jgi:5-methylcytosine-specific restriction protein A
MPLAPKRHGDEARKARQAEYERQRGNAAERGYDRDWEALKERFKREHPMCRICWERDGRAVPMHEVDHIIPFRDPSSPLRLDWNNLQSLCKPCHSRKTATHDGGFGR